MEVVEIGDQETYRKQTRRLLDTVVSSGAAVFRGLESDNIIK